jgi:1-deoxy-D-xylulose-5-phosphate synthase
MRLFPNMTVMAPGDAFDMQAMVEFSTTHAGPCSLRYPKAQAETVEGPRQPIQLGRAEVLRWGTDGAILCFGTLLNDCVRAAEMLRQEGLDVGVVNARFVKPLDQAVIERVLSECPFVVTVEEAALAGGFGSAVLELAADLGLDASHTRRLGLPDRFVEHGERHELLADLGLTEAGIADTCRELAAARQKSPRVPGGTKIIA